MHRGTALALLAASSLQAVGGLTVSHSLVYKKVGADAAKAVAAAKGRSTTGAAALVNDQGFWFSNFTIGASPDLEILIDSGSSDAILNPGVYKPSAKSVNTGRTFTVSYATTNPDGSGTETAKGKVYEDIISQHGTNLSVAKQYLGAITSPASPPSFPHQGLIGYAGADESALNENPFFTSLCNAGELTACRFGLALNTDATGTLYYGEVATAEFSGALATAPISEQWTVQGDIAYDGKVVRSDATIITDSGTTVIFGPVADVKALFSAAGIQAVETSNPAGVTGYYPCSSPPSFGFGFPSAAGTAGRKRGASATSTVFNVLPAALQESKVGNNCTASIHGTSDFGDSWLVGQAFFQGRYIDHNVDAGTMGFANLKA